MVRIKGAPSEQLNIVGLVVTVAVLVIITLFVDMAELRAFIAEAGIWAPLLFIVLKATTVVVAPLSGAPLYPLVGLLFGFWPGILYVVIGDLIGISTAFWISRIFGYPLVRRVILGKERGMLARVVDHIGTTKGFIHMCLTCFALPELIAYASGLSRLPYWKLIVFYMPISITVSCAAVLFGSLLAPSNSPLFLAIGMPIAAVAVIGAGGWLFLRGVGKDEDEA